MWDSPIYKFNQLVRTESGGKRRYRQVVVDVTGSAPPFKSPGKTLGRALDLAFAKAGVSRSTSILDVGAGKLRNTLHLLGKRYKVCSVEYEALFEQSAQAKTALAQASRYVGFSRLIYPHQFFTSTKRFDFALLINVLNIMPVVPERLMILELCNKKLRRGGHLLWYTQRGDSDYVSRMLPKYRLGDGYFVGVSNRYKTFYREFTVADIDSMLESAGFELVCPIAASARNQARLYRKLNSSAVSRVLTPRAIQSANVSDEKIPTPAEVKPTVVGSRAAKKVGNPDPEPLKRPLLFIEALRKIPVGRDHAVEYQRHVRSVLEVLFPEELKNLSLETSVFGGIKRLDILASNRSKSGFFHSLSLKHQVVCPFIVIECKNYGHEVGNPEFDQLGSRLGRKIGRFGLLAFRSANNGAAVIRRCAEIFDNDDKIVLPLSDDDFAELLTLKNQDNEGGIEDYLDHLVLKVKAG